MGQSKHNAKRQAERTAAYKKVWRTQFVRATCLVFLPLVAMISFTFASLTLNLTLNPFAVGCFGISILVYLYLSIRDGIILDRSSIYKKDSEPFSFWCTIIYFSALALLNIFSGILLLISE